MRSEDFNSLQTRIVAKKQARFEAAQLSCYQYQALAEFVLTKTDLEGM